MRRRRLYRYSRERASQEQASAQQEATTERQAYQNGVGEGMRIAAMQQNRIVAEAQRSALVAAHQQPFILMARRNGYDEGYSAGIQAGQSGEPRPEVSKDARFTYVDVEAARQRGVQEGKASAATGAANEGQIRGKVIDDMLQQCHVISESNPGMAPGVNAVRHLIKKLAR